LGSLSRVSPLEGGEVEAGEVLVEEGLGLLIGRHRRNRARLHGGPPPLRAGRPAGVRSMRQTYRGFAACRDERGALGAILLLLVSLTRYARFDCRVPPSVHSLLIPSAECNIG
jgi:hypothetical protein